VTCDKVSCDNSCDSRVILVIITLMVQVKKQKHKEVSVFTKFTYKCDKGRLDFHCVSQALGNLQSSVQR
jgi:hypothetical protein